ncbi:hypothetical protein ACVJGD_003921 [Bradyrhizobium sp. USDA 10063]
MCDAMDAVSRGAVPEISRGASAGSDEDDATRKELFLCRAAFRISWLLVLVLRNASTSAAPLDLAYGGGSMAISRLVTEGDSLRSEPDLKLVCGGARLFFIK